MMIIGIGTPKSQSSIGIVSSLPRSRRQAALIPRTIAMLPALNRGETCRKCAEQQSSSDPKCQLHSILPRSFESIFRLNDDVIDPFLGVGIAYAGLLSNNMGDINSIGWLQAAAVCEAGRPESYNLGPGRIVVRSG